MTRSCSPPLGDKMSFGPHFRVAFFRVASFLSTNFGFLRAGLGYGEEVHWSIILGEGNNMIGYEMGSSPIGVYIAANMVTFSFYSRSFMDDKFLGQSQTIG